MSVYLTIPSARPVAEVNARMAKWRKQGYRVALWRDWDEYPGCECDFMVTGNYPGYAIASNSLIKHVFANDPSCDWVVCGGDDVDPDINKTADEIAGECSFYFAKLSFDRLYEKCHGKVPEHLQLNESNLRLACKAMPAATFGVMQPTGDRYGDDAMGRARWPDAPAYIDRICGSPWIGREFARRINQGNGPWWPEYAHMFPDEELLNVAKGLGALWQRRDLIHYHDHWTRKPNGAHIEDMPPHLEEASSHAHWAKYEALFLARKAEGFPGSELIP